MPTFFAEELRDQLAPVMTDDLGHYLDGLGEIFREVEDIARIDQDGRGVWEKLLDPVSAVNTATLLWLAQMAGVRVPQGLGIDDMRTFIMLAESRRRGRLDYMVELAQETLTGARTVVTTERVGGEAYQLRVVTRTSETPDPANTEKVLRSAKPAGIVLEYEAVDGITWDEAISDWDDTSLTWQDTVDEVP